MQFQEDKKDALKSYFECRRHFKPSDQLIEIGLDGDITGATQTQKDFFVNIEDNYSTIAEAISPLVEDEFRNWHDDFRISNFESEFIPIYLRIPRCENKPFIWEIALESIHDSNHTITVTMSGFNANDVLIDG